MLKKLSVAAAIILGSVFLFSCSKGSSAVDPNLNKVNFNAALNGFNVVPSNSSSASGNVSATYDTVTNNLAFVISYNGFIPTQWHIHKGAVGASGVLVFDLGAIIGPPVLFNQILTQGQELDLLNNLYYIDLHSAAYGNGEIRGQLIH